MATASSRLCMVALTRPNSITGQTARKKRASEVPPVVDGSGSTPVSVFAPDPDADVIARYREADVERLIFNLAPEGEGSALTTLDAWAKLIA